MPLRRSEKHEMMILLQYNEVEITTIQIEH